MRRILVVDDEEILANVIATRLSERFEAEVYKVCNAVAAMEIMRKMKFSILITDIEMPAISGLELADFVKKNWPSCHIIIMTAYSEFEYAYHALQYDNIDYTLKIDGFDQLETIIQKRLEQLDYEEMQKEHYNRLDDAKSEMSSYFRTRTVEKFLGYDMKVKQEELDILKIPFSMEKPILLAVGTLLEDLTVDDSGGVFSIPEYIENSMKAKRIKVLFYVKNDDMIWFFQSNEENTDDITDIVYIRECFHELVELVHTKMHNQMSLIIGAEFVDISELNEVYQNALMLLKQNPMPGCVRMLQNNFKIVQNMYPSADELNYLLILLKKRNDTELLAIIEKKMGFLREIKDLHRKLPIPAVLALEVLLQESERLYNLTESKESEFVRKLYSADNKITGGEWLDIAKSILQQRIKASIKTTGIHQNHLIQWVEEYINENYMKDISLTLLADLVNYSPMYLSRLYSEQTGKTLIDAINCRRIEAAQELLSDSGLKIKDIAVKVGFYSVKHFNQVFKRYLGIAPSEYRKKIN